MHAPGDLSLPTGTERLFFAVWPDAEVRDRLAALADEALPAGMGRRVPASNLHLTLVFLGAVDANQRACVERAATNVRGAPVRLVLEEVEWRRKTGIVWVGPRATPPALARLVSTLTTELRACGFTPGERVFKAHVTLARDVPRGRSYRLSTPIVWSTRQLSLVSSQTLPAGSRYTVARCWDFCD